MSKNNNRRAILAKAEATYGVDSIPTGLANAIAVKNLSPNPIDANTVSRELIKSSLGNSDSLIANKHSSVTFEIELAGAKTAGALPAYDCLMKACAMKATVLAADLSGEAQAGSANSITLVAAGSSATDNAYRGLTVTITGGTGAGQSNIIKSYDGDTKVATMLKNWTTPPDATSDYTIGAGVVYTPVSENFDSATIYCLIDGIRHRITGARGTVELDITASAIPVFKFNFMGIFNTVTDVAMPQTDFDGFAYPLVANVSNTPEFEFFGKSGLTLQQFTFNLNNTTNFRALIGTEYAQITDRKSEGLANFEATAMADLDIFAQALGTDNGAIMIRHGITAGNIVQIVIPKADITTPTYGESDGVVMFNTPYAAIPNLGDDEVFIVVR